MSNLTAPNTSAPPTAVQFPQLHLANTLGALLIGGLLSFLLYGITFTQTYIYYQRSQTDRPFLKILVLVLWCLDTFDTFLNGHLLYHYLVDNFANPLAIECPVWSVVIHVAVTSITDFIVRMMFARRIFKLSQSYALSGAVAAISFVDLICGLIITGKAFGLATYTELKSISKLFYLNFASGTAGDLYVALVLCYFLHSSRTGFSKTDSLINVLMMYTVNTGLLTALDAAAGMITYIVMPNNFIFIAFYLNLSKLYVNSYLATLNARGILRERSSNIVSIQLSRFPDSSRGTDLETMDSQSPVERKQSSSVDHQPDEIAGIRLETVAELEGLVDSEQMMHRGS